MSELPPDIGRYQDEPSISCGLFCEAAEKETSVMKNNASTNGATNQIRVCPLCGLPILGGCPWAEPDCKA